MRRRRRRTCAGCGAQGSVLPDPKDHNFRAQQPGLNPATGKDASIWIHAYPKRCPGRGGLSGRCGPGADLHVAENDAAYA